jgi:hypothetical protein
MVIPIEVEQIKRGKIYVDSIIKEYEDIPNSDGMKFLQGVVDLEAGTKQDVILRNITEDYWSMVIEQSNNFRVCSLGTPGIGKTTTTCILIRLLLFQNKTVVYHVRTEKKNGWVFKFSPTYIATTFDVDVIPEKFFELKMIDEPSAYYVVDPGLTKTNCNPPVDFKFKVIIVASPDEGHWGASSFSKKRGQSQGIFLYYPVWTLQELIMACEIYIHFQYKY